VDKVPREAAPKGANNLFYGSKVNNQSCKNGVVSYLNDDFIKYLGLLSFNLLEPKLCIQCHQLVVQQFLR
jgi:hypothetical protein